MENQVKKIVPLYDRVLLKPLYNNKTKGGLSIPHDVSKNQLTRAQIMVVGPGKLNADTNTFLRTQLEPGEIVFIASYGGMRIKTDRETDYIVDMGGTEILLDKDTEYIVQKEDEVIMREVDTASVDTTLKG